MEQTLNKALLVMDMQLGIIPMLPGAEELLDKLNKAIATAREQKIPVIYVVVGFRPGAREVSPNNKSFSAGQAAYAQMDMTEFMTVHPDITLAEGDMIVTKRRVSAFSGSDLEVVLRSLNIQHLVLTGIATGGVVLSTVREAADKDYKLTVIADCCADRDPEVHHVLMTKVFVRQADVISLEEWCG
jgi:nicotinamidase-related amidase